MCKKEKNVLKNTLLPMRFQRRHHPKAVDHHNARNLSLMETESLSGSMCGRQDLQYNH